MTSILRSLGSLLLLCASQVVAAEPVLTGGNFESDRLGRPPASWTVWRDSTEASVVVSSPGAGGSQRCVRGKRSVSTGLVALSKAFTAPQRRILIEFSFAFSEGRGRSLNLWSHTDAAEDASQVNICIQGGRLLQYDGRTRRWEVISERIQASPSIQKPVWHRLRALVDFQQAGIDFWLSQPGRTDFSEEPTATLSAYRTELLLSGIDLVSGQRIAPDCWYLVDDLVVLGGEDLPPPHAVETIPELPERYELWTGSRLPNDVEQVPMISHAQHRTIHRASADGYKFLHGAAIVQHQGVFYANWANSPTNENGPHETLQGRRSADGGLTWSQPEIIGPGFKGQERHSHGVLFVHQDQLWTICSRFGVGVPGRRFPGLRAEAFVLNQQSDRWESRGVVMRNCWPYDRPVRMRNGNWITGGQDKDGLPVVAISRGDDFTHWDSILIPFHPQLAPSFAETTVCTLQSEKVESSSESILAVIRGGRGVAWVSTSGDGGRSWQQARPSNLPMPRAKAYLSRLSTGQLYLLSNLQNRDTLVVSVSRPHQNTLSRLWRIRHGKSVPPRFPGKAKGKQWSYPYGYEHDGKLFVVYSIGKEDCGLSVIPIRSLAH